MNSRFGKYWLMPVRILLLISLIVNLIFAVVWVFGTHSFPAMPLLSAVRDIDAPSHSNRSHTNVVVRRQNFTWQEVESDNYVTYIQNLREIGCPPSTIRDIIVADVNALYAHRRASEIVSADHQWWKSVPDLDAVQSAADQIKELETERRTLLTRLLGEGWERASNPAPPAVRTGISLTGPVLGELASETKEAIYQIAGATQEKIDAYQERQRRSGEPIDPAELTRLRQESRAELANILNPAQMEEFLLRYSNTAFTLRDELREQELTPEEFRNLFRLRDSIEQQDELYYSGDDPQKLRRKQELQAEREAALAEVLGKERYASHLLRQDPIFQQSQATAEQLGVPAELVLPIYQINRLTEAEQQRIQNDATLSAEEKIDAIAAAQAEQEKSLQTILGLEVLKRLKNPDSAPQ